MKWHKFRRIREQTPWILWYVGLMDVTAAPLNYPRGEATRRLRHWVRHHVGYIAFRPFDSLNLDCGNASEGTREEWVSTTFSVRLHIGGADEPFGRLRYVTSKVREDGHDETSIRKVMLELQSWHQKCWEKRGNPLSLDAVVKVIQSGSRAHGPRTQSLEIFPIPVGFRV